MAKGVHGSSAPVARVTSDKTHQRLLGVSAQKSFLDVNCSLSALSGEQRWVKMKFAAFPVENMSDHIDFYFWLGRSRTGRLSK
jgi:hypothetical protein